MIDRIEMGAGGGGGTDALRREAMSLYRGVDPRDGAGMARLGAEELVSKAFIQPVFEMMRRNPLKSDLFGQSSGERTFGPMLDAEFSKAIVGGAGFGLVDRLARDLQGLPSREEVEEAWSKRPLNEKLARLRLDRVYG